MYTVYVYIIHMYVNYVQRFRDPGRQMQKRLAMSRTGL